MELWKQLGFSSEEEMDKDFDKEIEKFMKKEEEIEKQSNKITALVEDVIWTEKENHSNCSEACRYLDENFPMGGRSWTCVRFHEDLIEKKRCLECLELFYVE
jgi:hypothetical protein